MVPAVTLTADQVEEYIVMMKRRSDFDPDGCGICEKGNPTVLWFSHHSKAAHRLCYQIIMRADEVLMKTINEQFKSKSDWSEHNFAHRKAVEAVKLACGDATLIEYFEREGEEALVHLFRTVGVQAANEYAELVLKKKTEDQRPAAPKSESPKRSEAPKRSEEPKKA